MISFLSKSGNKKIKNTLFEEKKGVKCLINSLLFYFFNGKKRNKKRLKQK